jgi:hypothetical protein
MVTKAPVNLDTSVRARLLNLGRQTGEDFTLTLTRYAIEGFFYRLSVAKHVRPRRERTEPAFLLHFRL